MKMVEMNMPEQDYSTRESFKALRSNLMFCGDDNRVIALTSCFENEGKSEVSLNLAAAIAASGYKVVLLDADMRKSRLIGHAQTADDIKGLSHYLSKQNTANEVVCSTNVKNLFVVFAGAVPPNPSELLMSERFKKLIELLRETVDYIIVDTPPLGMVTDSSIIASQCDGTILVVESGKNSYRAIRKVKEQLDKANANVLGVVLNKVDLEREKYYGKHYGSYYGRYYGGYGSYGKNE